MMIYHGIIPKNQKKNIKCKLSFLNLHLVGGWTNPFENYARQNGFIFPNFRGEHENKSLSCHHPVILRKPKWMFPKILVPPKSSILIGFSIINHPFGVPGTPFLGNTQMFRAFWMEKCPLTPFTTHFSAVLTLNLQRNWGMICWVICWPEN